PSHMIPCESSQNVGWTLCPPPLDVGARSDSTTTCVGNQTSMKMRSGAVAVADVRQSDEIELRDRLIVALDVPNQEQAFELVEKLGDTVRFYKIGLQLHFAGGLEL